MKKRNLKKQILVPILAGMMALALYGCGDKTNKDNESTTDIVQKETTTVEELTESGETSVSEDTDESVNEVEGTTAGETTAGETTAEETTAGETTAGETTVEETTVEETTVEETTTEEVTTTENIVNEDVTTGSYTGDFSEFSSETIHFGVGKNRTEDGRYEGPLSCQRSMEGYKVDFIKENEKVIYLTFDEGYENGYTPQILDTLKEKNVKAVFFVTMDWAQSQPELLRRMIDEGHVVGNHSVKHKSMPTLSVAEMTSEIMELHNYIKENYNYDMYLFRPPMGHYSEQSLKVLENLGYTTVLWSFAYVDWDTENQPSNEEALSTCLDRIHNGAIYLLHAVSEANTAILGDFIDNARNLGYTFVEYTRQS